MMEARALSVEGERSFLNYTSFLGPPLERSQESFNRLILSQANGNGESKGFKVKGDVGVNGKVDGRVLSFWDWMGMWNYVVSSSFVRNEIKKRYGYITGITVEDLLRDAYVVGMEELKKCREGKFCDSCNWADCAVWEKKFQVSLRKTLRRLQDLDKKNSRIGYLELVEEENGSERLPTTYRRDWDMSANLASDPLTLLCMKEEEREEIDKEDERIRKVRKALSKLRKREREVWEFLLEGMSPHEVAKRLGYKRVQGVYMVIRRTTKRLRRFLKYEERM